MNVPVAFLFSQPFAVGSGFIVIIAIKDQLGAQGPQGRYLERIGLFRKGDKRPCAKHAAGTSDGLPMIAGGGGDEAPLSFFLAEMGQKVNASPAFEGSQWQVLVVFQVNLGLQHVTQARGKV